MQVRLIFDQFSIEQATASLLRADWINDPDHQIVHKSAYGPDDAFDFEIQETGSFHLWISELTVRVAASGQLRKVQGVIRPLTVLITDDDRRAGSVSTRVPQEGLFRITYLNRDRQPIPYGMFLLALESGSVELKMDSAGCLVTLDNPTSCPVVIPAGTGVLVEHIDL